MAPLAHPHTLTILLLTSHPAQASRGGSNGARPLQLLRAQPSAAAGPEPNKDRSTALLARSRDKLFVFAVDMPLAHHLNACAMRAQQQCR